MTHTISLDNAEPIVFSVGGSLIVPSTGIDIEFLKDFRVFVERLISMGRKVVIVVGGGNTARKYQEAAKAVAPLEREDLDWLGIHSTRLNGHLMRTIIRDLAHPVMIKNPTKIPKNWSEPVLVLAGWKPGWSTDYVAVRAAKKIGGKLVVNLSNIDLLYTADPKKDPTATPIYKTTWSAFRAQIGNEWDPGMNVPFDPVASKLADESKMTVLLLGGADLKNVEAAVTDKMFKGTMVIPDILDKKPKKA